jgi:hypothetical protein
LRVGLLFYGLFAVEFGFPSMGFEFGCVEERVFDVAISAWSQSTLLVNLGIGHYQGSF